MIASIDIGTSYSSISMLDPDGKAQPVDIGTGVSMYGSKYSLPSAVFVEDDGRVLLGQDALNNRMRNPQRFRDEFKRNLGETIPIILGSRSFLPEELYTEFFRHMKDRAEKVSGEQIELAYLTHPAAYGTSKKNKILSAAKAAGLYDVELVDEPAAAAMSYCAAGYIKDGQNLLIYDFGGGTFDTALIRYENGSFTLLTAPRGLERCGGIDIDRLIFRDMLSKVDPAMLSMLQANNLHYMRFVSQLSELAVKCKHQLSSPEADSFSGYIQVGFDMIPYMLTLEQYNQMIAGMVGQTIQTCRQMLTDAKMKVEDLSAVLLVGGTSRVRLVRELVEQMAGKVPVYCAVDLELAVSQGALNYRNYKKPEPEPIPAPEPIPEPKQQNGETTEIEKVLRNVLDKYPEVDPEERHEISRQASYMELGGLPKDDVVLLWNDQLGFCMTQRGIYKEKRLGEFGQFVSWDTFTKCEIIRIHYDRHPIKFRLPNSNQCFEICTKFDSVAFLRDLQNELRKLEAKKNGNDPVCDESDFEEHDLIKANVAFLRGRELAFEGNWDEAYLTFHTAAKMGSAEAMYDLADCHKYGLGTEVDLSLAEIWYQEAAERGVYDAEPYLAKEDSAGHEDLSSEKNINKAHDEFLKGRKLAREQNWSGAFICFFRAAKMGDPDAMYSVATCYRQGLGTEKNAELSDIWNVRATEARISSKTSVDNKCLEHNVKPKAVFSAYNTSIENGSITVEGSLCGKVPLTDLEHLGVFDDAGRFLGQCRAHLFADGISVSEVTNDSESVTIRLSDFTGQIYDELDIDYLISMPVNERSFDQVFADMEQEGYYTTRVTYEYEDPNMRIDFEDAYFFYVTEIKDGKIYGRSVRGSMSNDLEMYVYNKSNPNANKQELVWKEHTATGHNAYFTADCNCVHVGDVITDCIAPPGYTFKCEQISFWRYRLIIAVQKNNVIRDASVDQVTAPKKLDEMGLDFSRKGQWRKAFEAYQKAANMNYAPAQYHLAGCYERGNGTVVDWNNAKIWYHRAAGQGYAAAKDKLRQLEAPKNKLTPREIIRKLVLQMPELKSDSKCWILESKEIPSWLSRLQSNTNVRDRSSILLAQDTTLFSSGKEGIIFTERGIHVYGGWMAPLKVIDWMTFAKGTLTMDSSGKSAYLNSRYISGSNYLPEGFWTNLHAEIKKLY